MTDNRQAHIVSRGYIAIADQGIVSAVTFITGIVLARCLAPREYGIFVIAYTVMLFLNGIQAALVVNPLMVLNAGFGKVRLREYLTATGLFQLCLGGALSLGVMLAFFAGSFFFSGAAVLTILPALGLTVFAFQCQEFFRRVLFSQMRFMSGLANDALSYGLQIGCIALLVYAKKVSAVYALYALSLSYFLAALAGWLQCAGLLTSRPAGFLDTVRKNWTHGKWLLGSNLFLWISNQAYLLITAFFVGPIGPAVLKACQNIVAPSHVVLYSLENIVPSSASRILAADGPDAFKRFLRKAARIVLGLVFPYFLIVSLFSESCLRLFYGGKYGGYGAVVVLIAAQYVAGSLNMIDMFTLRALHRPRSIFYSYSIASVLTVVVSIPLVRYFGVIGGAIGALISSIAVFLPNHYASKSYASKL